MPKPYIDVPPSSLHGVCRLLDLPVGLLDGLLLFLRFLSKP